MTRSVGQRQVADAHAGRLGERVADRAGDRPQRELARTDLALARGVHELDHDFRGTSVNRRIG